ncbi:alpha/beta hydrolase [Agromyces silvae]|uniref:alpha/beta hydrolase n=1 Tax=Agromyces silvae TaxID=3388266 RepID=UPI00280B048B|nr:alpha/beta hydrolase-fold protein [Agromyces protaetiae]
MAVLSCAFRSEVLELSSSFTAILPEGTAARGLLYLLHGLSDDDTMWLRHTAIERYAAARGLAVVMPQVHRSYYTDEAHGGAYWSFLTTELPAMVQRMFQVPVARDRTFVAGLSMGGYGAMKWALRHPERFAAAASLSGALGLAARTVPGAGRLESGLWDRIFDSQSIVGGEDDVVHLLHTRSTGATLPALRVCCGTEDALYDENRVFVTAARERNLPIDVDFGPGAHTWDYWDRRIGDVISWLPVPA